MPNGFVSTRIADKMLNKVSLFKSTFANLKLKSSDANVIIC